MRRIFLCLFLAAAASQALAPSVSAQAQQSEPAAPAADAGKGMVGVWELSNSDRDRVCNLTFKSEPARSGSQVEFDAACRDAIPPLKEVEGWSLANQTLKLIDARITNGVRVRVVKSTLTHILNGKAKAAND